MKPLVILGVGLVLWILSIYLVRKWKYFWIFFAVNFAILTIYTIYTIYGNLSFLGHDEYGLGRLIMLFAVPLIHVLVAFVLAIIIRYRLKKITIAN
ncbi:hypothetical protein FB2170_11046 [Maribacter sp. HTCC2170]|nr:hypothetical protein FB2170_11046 [Maribacter sp. HTCC2170]